MKMFDIYYKNKKINKKPLSHDEVNMVLDQNVIYKKNLKTNEIEKIETSKINCVKCTVIR